MTYRLDPGDGSAVVVSDVPRLEHTYDGAGTYDGRLEVVDDEGLVGAVDVVLEPTGRVRFAADPFDRVVDRSWGEAADGGGYAHLWVDSDFTVDGRQGLFDLPRAGMTRSAWLPDTELASGDVGVTFSVSELPADDGVTWMSTSPRRVAFNTDYRARLRLFDDGSVRLGLAYRDGSGVDQTLVDVPVGGLEVERFAPYRVRVEARGTGPTVLRAKVWDARTPEPGWMITATDDTASLQTVGSPMMIAYIPSSYPVEALPVDVRVDNVVGIDRDLD